MCPVWVQPLTVSKLGFQPIAHCNKDCLFVSHHSVRMYIHTYIHYLPSRLSGHAKPSSCFCDGFRSEPLE